LDDIYGVMAHKYLSCAIKDNYEFNFYLFDHILS